MSDHIATDAGGTAENLAVPPAFAHLREDVVAVLSSWWAPTPRLDVLRRELLAVAEERPGCTWRDDDGVHFTASLVLLDADLENVALTLHGKAKRWFQFGGHFEETDASVAAAASREGREESGTADFTLLDGMIQVDAHDLSAAFGRCRTHLDLRFAGVCAPGAELAISDESDDVRWWPLSALPADTEPSLREAVEFAQASARRTGLGTGP